MAHELISGARYKFSQMNSSWGTKGNEKFLAVCINSTPSPWPDPPISYWKIKESLKNTFECCFSSSEQLRQDCSVLGFGRFLAVVSLSSIREKSPRSGRGSF